MTSRLLVLLLGGFVALATPAAAPQDDELDYRGEFFPGSEYDPSVPTPESILGFPVGERTATPEQIGECLEAWARASSRMRVREYARTHEGRPLWYVILTSRENISRLDEIHAGVEKLADPRGLSGNEAERLIASLPAVAWMAYSIHGDETSGADAALAVIYHLAAARDEAVESLLDDLVVLIDPMMNPDGRGRFVQQIAEHRGAQPNIDDQSLLHTGYWPWGRMNHYLFDLNRDWILGVHPETRGRIRAAGGWHPLFFVDAHEMGAQDTYLFSPPRDPRNPNFPGWQAEWMETFAREQGGAFDRAGWTYYTGEWNEGWYPGYSNAWAGFRGAIGFLYEQAGIAEDAVRRPEGTLLTYRESVHHQVASSLANLNSLRDHAGAIWEAYLSGRRLAVAADGPYANRTFAILPTANRSRLRAFLDLMVLQGFELFTAGAEFTVPEATDQLGIVHRRKKIPAGTLLIPNRQPEAHLVAAMLEFDPRIPEESLRKERKELLLKGKSRIYDTTAWNLTMLQGLEALTLSSELPGSAVRYEPGPARRAPVFSENGTPVAWIIDGADDLSVAAAARLMERGIQVRIVDLPITFKGESFSRGSVVVIRSDNRSAGDRLGKLIAGVAADLNLAAVTTTTGFGDGDLPDLGGRHFRLLERPRIGLLARGGISAYDFGAIWHTLDRKVGIRHSHLAEDFLQGTDLNRYNVLVLPDRWFGKWGVDLPEKLKGWVEAGGTLVAIARSAGFLAGKDSTISKVRLLPDVLEKLEEYQTTLIREWMGRSGIFPDGQEIWAHEPGTEVTYPWERIRQPEKPQGKEWIEELKRRDEWQKLFMPKGAFLAGRVDPEHWLTFGTGAYLPIHFGNHPVLMSVSPVETPIRLGYLTPQGNDSSGEDPGNTQVGWAGVPEGHDLYLRMSGLLWPEAAQRLAHAAYLTREPVGRGQVILFAAPPIFRGTTLGTERLLMNALVYGPGLGTKPTLSP